MTREYQESCVWGRFSHHALTNLSPNLMANWFLAAHHSRGGIFHVCATWRKTRYSNLIAASSVGKCPLVRRARRRSEKLTLPFRDLIGVDIELLRQLDPRLLALDCSQSHSCLEGRGVVATRAFRHLIS
jgi:hypothetical protein